MPRSERNLAAVSETPSHLLTPTSETSKVCLTQRSKWMIGLLNRLNRRATAAPWSHAENRLQFVIVAFGTACAGIH
jgi:hypothetical protein